MSTVQTPKKYCRRDRELCKNYTEHCRKEECRIVEETFASTAKKHTRQENIKVRVGGSISQSNQIYLGIPQGGVLSVTLFLVAINGILRELGNGVDGSLFTDDLAFYITTRNQRVTTGALQGVLSIEVAAVTMLG